MDRRDVFKTLNKPFKNNADDAGNKLVRPPYFSDEAFFVNGCIFCDDKSCVSACEEDIIKIYQDKTPYLDFSISGCTYCDECAKACNKGVLGVEYKKNIDFLFKIDTKKCLSWNKTMCFSCKDPCLDDAISFTNMFNPVIVASKCVSCGFCVGVCPTGAIEFIKI